MKAALWVAADLDRLLAWMVYAELRVATGDGSAAWAQPFSISSMAVMGWGLEAVAQPGMGIRLGIRVDDIYVKQIKYIDMYQSKLHMSGSKNNKRCIF